MTALTALMAMALIGYYWYNQVTALDACRQAGKKLTQQQGWAFLDDSLLQKKIKIKTRRGKLALYREFMFEFSDAEAQRFKGTITHHGGVVTEIKFFHHQDIATFQLTH
ncbi:DUF3301 domain-containing protein [Marinicella meishanensis]|uniref:DUF3301 domain-containing protein n=1 Tax=Marinicella meishanensis TaxID=2873263 RepID=UPI001CBB1283|nr:DUF3301 domain-containing protein [Marinicella sp. NBU2979]